MKTEKRILATLSTQQIQQLVSYHPKSLTTHRLHVLVLAILDSGIRIDEALKLEWANVDFENLLRAYRLREETQRTADTVFV